MQLQVGKLPIKPEELHRMHLPWQKEEGENKLCLWGLDFKSSGRQEVEFSEGARVSRATMFFYKRVISGNIIHIYNIIRWIGQALTNCFFRPFLIPPELFVLYILYIY